MTAELIPNRLATLKNGFNRLDAILGGPNWRGNLNDAIALEPAGAMYSVTNGRHRVFLAKQGGYKAVWARIIGR